MSVCFRLLNDAVQQKGTVQWLRDLDRIDTYWGQFVQVNLSKICPIMTAVQWVKWLNKHGISIARKLMNHLESLITSEWNNCLVFFFLSTSWRWNLPFVAWGWYYKIPVKTSATIYRLAPSRKSQTLCLGYKQSLFTLNCIWLMLASVNMAELYSRYLMVTFHVASTKTTISDLYLLSYRNQSNLYHFNNGVHLNQHTIQTKIPSFVPMLGIFIISLYVNNSFISFRLT